MQTAIRLFRRHKWRLWLLVFLYGVAFAGNHALRISTETLHVGEINPTHDAVLTFQQNTCVGSDSICVRDVKTGRVLVDLADFGIGRGHRIDWSTNGNLLVVLPGKPEERCIAEIKLRPQAKIVQRTNIDSDNIELVMSDSQGQLVHVATDFRTTNRPSFSIIDDVGNLIRRVEFGRDETVWLSPSRDGSKIVAHFRAKRTGDNVFTDGKSISGMLTTGVLHLDAMTSETLHRHQGVYVSIWQGDEYLAIPTTPPAGWNIVHIDQPNKPVLTLGAGIPLRIDDDKFAAYDTSGALGKLSIYDITSNDPPRVIALPLWGEAQVASVATGKMFVVTKGWLQRMDVFTAEISNLVNFRPYFRIARATALIGMPLFAIVWLTFSWRRTDMSPNLEVAAVMLSCIAVLVFWSKVPSAAEIGLNHMLDFAIFVFFGAMVTLGLVWVSTLQLAWAQGLPIITLASAAFLVCFVAWRKGDGEAMLFLCVGGVFIVCFFTGLRLLPGKWRTSLSGRTNDTQNPSSSRTQFGLKHAGTAMASFAVLFLAMRLINWNDLQVDPTVFAWLGTFTPLMAAVMVISVGAGLRDGNVFFSAFIFAVFTATLVGTHLRCTIWFAPAMLKNGPPIHLIGIVGALFVFIAMQYRRMQFVRS